MNVLIGRIKQGWHTDLLRNPATHAWVLNLYLNGERYPQTVSDYFQIEYAPTRELGEQLRQHSKDEHRHEVLFANALKSIGQAVVDLPSQDVAGRRPFVVTTDLDGLRAHGNVHLGTDYSFPPADMAPLALIKSAGLSKADTDAIVEGNPRRLFSRLK